MQLTSIPNNVLTANQQVADALRTANDLTVKAQSAVESRAAITPSVASDVKSALAAATQAQEGVASLGRGNLLDGTFQRYSNHAVRDLSAAVDLLDRSGDLSKDARAILVDRLFDAEVSTRLGAEAGDRSLRNPSARAIERASDFGGGSSTGSSGPAWVDGAWLDELGNPVRGGGDSWTGPDGASYGWDGSPGRGGGDEYVGPDGVGYSGI